jgi:hypothetical protein
MSSGTQTAQTQPTEPRRKPIGWETTKQSICFESFFAAPRERRELVKSKKIRLSQVNMLDFLADMMNKDPVVVEGFRYPVVQVKRKRILKEWDDYREAFDAFNDLVDGGLIRRADRGDGFEYWTLWVENWPNVLPFAERALSRERSEARLASRERSAALQIVPARESRVAVTENEELSEATIDALPALQHFRASPATGDFSTEPLALIPTEVSQPVDFGCIKLVCITAAESRHPIAYTLHKRGPYSVLEFAVVTKTPPQPEEKVSELRQLRPLFEKAMPDTVDEAMLRRVASYLGEAPVSEFAAECREMLFDHRGRAKENVRPGYLTTVATAALQRHKRAQAPPSYRPRHQEAERVEVRPWKAARPDPELAGILSRVKKVSNG